MVISMINVEEIREGFRIKPDFGLVIELFLKTGDTGHIHTASPFTDFCPLVDTQYPPHNNHRLGTCSNVFKITDLSIQNPSCLLNHPWGAFLV